MTLKLEGSRYVCLSFRLQLEEELWVCRLFFDWSFVCARGLRWENFFEGTGEDSGTGGGFRQNSIIILNELSEAVFGGGT